MNQQKKSTEELNREMQELSDLGKRLNVDEERLSTALHLCSRGIIPIEEVREPLEKYQKRVEENGFVLDRKGNPIKKKLVF